MTDWQYVIDVAFVIGGGLGGWILATLWKEIKDARDDHAQLLSRLPDTYARRDDVALRFDQIVTTLNKMSEKMDNTFVRRDDVDARIEHIVSTLDKLDRKIDALNDE